MSPPAFPPPLHPSISPRLSSEYHNFYATHPAPILTLTDTWDPSLRDPASPSRTTGPKTAREPVGGVASAEIAVRWGPGEGVLDVGEGVGVLGRKAGMCKVGVYWPLEQTEREKKGGGSLPIFVYIPGGGFVFPTPGPEPNSFISRVCMHAQCVVVVPRTRLAPEDPWPAAVEDAMGVCRWVLEGAEDVRQVVDGLVGEGRVWVAGKGKRAVGGASAGGCLAAVIALHLPSHIPPPALLLFNPLLDNSSTPNPAYDSHTVNAHCPDLPVPLLDLFRQLYLPPTTPVPLTHPLVSPMYASTDALERLGRVWVCVGECDSVRDEGVVFAQRVKQVGGSVQFKVYKGAAHAYTVQDAALEVGRQYIDDVIQDLRSAFE